MRIPKKFIVSGAGVASSNGEFIKNNLNSDFFYNQNGSHIELTADGWLLMDKIVDEQTYLISTDFNNVQAAGDCILPVPTVEVIE